MHSAVRREGGKGSGGWNQGVRKHESEDGDQIQCQSQPSVFEVSPVPEPVGGVLQSCIAFHDFPFIAGRRYRVRLGVPAGEWGVPVWNERAYAYHLRLQFFHIPYVLYDVTDSLVRTSDHDAGSRLVADGFQGADTLETVP